MARPGKATLELFDVSGALVRVLVDGRVREGLHTEVWDGRTGDGRKLPSGVYLYRLRAGEFEATRKMVYLR